MAGDTSSVVLAVVGLAVGFAGGLSVEWLRGWETSRRETRDRRERFQVETLTRLQGVLSEHYLATLDAVGAARRLGAGELDESVLITRAAAAERLAASAAELILHVSRIRSAHIVALQEAFWRAANAAQESEQTEELRQKRIDATQKLYAMTQSAIGREIQHILYQEADFRRGLFGWVQRRRAKHVRPVEGEKPTPRSGSESETQSS